MHMRHERNPKSQSASLRGQGPGYTSRALAGGTLHLNRREACSTGTATTEGLTLVTLLLHVGWRRRSRRDRRAQALARRDSPYVPAEGARKLR